MRTTSPTWWPATVSRTRSSKRHLVRHGLRTSRHNGQNLRLGDLGRGAGAFCFCMDGGVFGICALGGPKKVLAGG